MAQLEAELVAGEALYRRVVLEKLAQARESVWISTANVKAMFVEIARPEGPVTGQGGRFAPVADLFAQLARKGVEIRLLHAELPSRPFRAAFDKQSVLVRGGMTLKICPRVHFKCVLIDGAWLYLGSANLTGAGLGAKHADARNFVLGVLTEDFQTIDQVAALFEAVWSGKACATCRLHADCPDPIGPGPAKGRARRGKGSDVRLGRARRLR